MLFRAVSGPELEAVYSYVARAQRQGRSVSEQELTQVFLPVGVTGDRDPEGNSLLKALGFLADAGLLANRNPYEVVPLTEPTFRLELISRVRNKELQGDTKQPANQLYLGLLSELFIRRDQFYIGDLLAEANAYTGKVKELSSTHLNDWGRVMSYLGLGERVDVKDRTAFYCMIRPDLLDEIICSWNETEASLDEFFRNHWSQYLAFENRDLKLAQVVQAALLYLQDRQRIELIPTQSDLGQKAFQIGNASYQRLCVVKEGKTWSNSPV